MGKLALIALIVVTAVYDAWVIWAIWFTMAWAGGLPPISAVGFWLFAASPLLATAYALSKVRTSREGKQPRP